MPNLVGIGNSQVPTNAMLGGLAYQDSVGEINLEKIKARTSDTAVDIFVYDTRKDSDGGAWRYRTQHLSWYNEGVSALRGARKQFPAVAVIVLESLKLTIYDGDDPNLPMWMVVTGANNNYAIETAATCTAALNGVVCIGCGGNGHDFYYVNFLQDAAFEISTSSLNRFHDNIGTRSSHNRLFNYSSNAIISRKINDVAMTVLPNTPINEIMGIPFPTIALATDDGVSVITNDGRTEGSGGFTVVDITSNVLLHHMPRNIDFFEDRLLWTEGNNYDLQDRAFLNAPVPVKDIQLIHDSGLPTGFIAYGIGKGATNTYTGYISLDTTLNNEYPSPRERKFQIYGSDNTIILGCKHAIDGGIEQIHQDTESPSNSMLNTITTSYNTGWMHGNTIGAFMSDTDTTNVTGTELVTNGTFDSNTNNWTALNSSSLSVSSNELLISYGSATSAGAYQDISVEAGKTYVWTYNGRSSDSGQLIKPQLRSQSGAIFVTSATSITNGTLTTNNGTIIANRSSANHNVNQVYSTTFKVSSSGTVRIELYANYNASAYFDNISVRVAVSDRSAKGNGLQVFGTITKSAVATNAELVSYSGFSATNYLEQPYNSNLNFNNNNFAVYGWFKLATNNSEQCIMMLMEPTGQVDYILVGQQSNGDMRFQVDSLNGASVAYASQLPTGVWIHYCGINIDDDKTYLYINGEPTRLHNGTLHGSNGSFDNTTGKLTFGRKADLSQYSGSNSKPFGGELALWRITTTIPSREQIKKMYHDEKCLFHEDAKCTLYGSSIPVTAIGFDDKTNTLHAGTASGRSDFRRLNRINNTTTAVTTSISASNELIAEQ